MKEKVRELERGWEMKERGDRRKNIIIKGEREEGENVKERIKRE